MPLKQPRLSPTLQLSALKLVGYQLFCSRLFNSQLSAISFSPFYFLFYASGVWCTAYLCTACLWGPGSPPCQSPGGTPKNLAQDGSAFFAEPNPG
jgi:hypothetical protein